MIFSLFISKLVACVLRWFNKGATTLPGRIALRLKPNILIRLSKGVSIICVTGTNGKTTTCSMIESVFKANSMSYFINKSGANMITGVATAFVLNSSIGGKCKKDYAILECDENSLPLISTYINPSVLVVTNVFRDQLDRYGEVSYTLSRIKQGISNMNNTVLVINCDCPLTSTLINDNTITYGTNLSLENTIVSDNVFCPYCNGKIEYKSSTYAQLGDYYCESCGYHRTRLDYELQSICENAIVINDKAYPISLDGIYNAYNYLSAFSACKALGISDVRGLYNFSGAFGRMEEFFYNDISILVMLVKNPVGLSNCVRFISDKKGEYNMAFALNDNSADGIDVSWIWDARFDSIVPRIDECYTVGTRSYDMAVRLKYDGIDSLVINGENYIELIDIIKSSSKDFIILSTYTSMMNMRHYLIKEFGGEEFWQ